MIRYKLTIQYDGTNYCGWQTQKNGVSVQETLVKALGEISSGEVKLVGSGRTDSGVHAKGQIAHVDMTTPVPSNKIPLAVNPYLPDDVKIICAEEVDDSFHARYSAKKKTYVYRTYVSPVVLPLMDRYALRIDSMPDLDKMKEGAKEIVGEHDFKCFLASGSSVENTVRTVYSLTVTKTGNEIEFKVCGNGFLYNMVRIIVGTLLDIGYNKRSVEDLTLALKTGERTLCGKTVGARGLCLDSVEY